MNDQKANDLHHDTQLLRKVPGYHNERGEPIQGQTGRIEFTPNDTFTLSAKCSVQDQQLLTTALGYMYEQYSKGEPKS